MNFIDSLEAIASTLLYALIIHMGVLVGGGTKHIGVLIRGGNTKNLLVYACSVLLVAWIITSLSLR